MFTGLVEDVGDASVQSARGVQEGLVLQVFCPYSDLVLGESVAVDGVCLTVSEKTSNGFLADVSKETLEKTTLGRLRSGASKKVNLERAMKADGRFGGHLVSGHVDAVVSLMKKQKVGNAYLLEIELPKTYQPFVVEKGSVCLNGTSLTVNQVNAHSFELMMIPHTLSKTTWGLKNEGDALNFEVDLVARYLARLVQFAPNQQNNAEEKEKAFQGLLKRSGYL